MVFISANYSKMTKSKDSIFKEKVLLPLNRTLKNREKVLSQYLTHQVSSLSFLFSQLLLEPWNEEQETSLALRLLSPVHKNDSQSFTQQTCELKTHKKLCSYKNP